MHELSIMHSALDDALREARRSGATRVHEIRLRVGALSGVMPDALRFAFEALAPGTMAEGATLTIENIVPCFWCARCEREFESPRFFAECPLCGEPSGELRRGRELELNSMEVEYV